MRRLGFAVLAVAAAMLVSAGAARADVLLPDPPRPVGPHDVPALLEFDLGPYASSAFWTYDVKAGDTLSGIARTELASARRWKEIPPLNPGLEPERLKIGQRLVMPPRSPPAPGSSVERYDVYLLSLASADPRPHPVVPGAAALQVASGTLLIAVPYANQAAFLAGLEGATDAASVGPRIETLRRSGTLSLSEGLPTTMRVTEDDPAPRVRLRVSLDRIEKDEVAFHAERLDAPPTRPAALPPGSEEGAEPPVIPVAAPPEDAGTLEVTDLGIWVTTAVLVLLIVVAFVLLKRFGGPGPNAS